MQRIKVRKGAANIFEDLAFSPARSAELLVKSRLIDAIGDTIDRRKLTRFQTAKLCGIDQPTLSKVLAGRIDSVTIDRLVSWLVALGRSVEIRVEPYTAQAEAGQLIAVL